MSDSAAPEILVERRRSLLTPLLLLLAGALYLAYLLFRPFLLTFTVSASVALLLAPAQRRLRAVLRGRDGVAAGLLVVLAAALILVPVVGAVTLLGQQALIVHEWAKPRLQPDHLRELFEQVLPRYPWLRDLLGFEPGEIPALVSTVLSRLASFTNDLIQTAATGLGAAFLDLGLFLLMLFFLLSEGPRLRAEFRRVSPLSREQEERVIEHLVRTVKGSLLALVAVPLVQAGVAFVGFRAFGVPRPLVWSAVVLLAAFVPLLGSPLGWLPACAYLFLEGRSGAALGLLVWGALLISGIDNLIKPLLLRNSARIHPMLAFLAILGGVFAFGPLGFLVGPVVLSLVLSALRIYRLDVLRRLAPVEAAAASLAAEPEAPAARPQ